MNQRPPLSLAEAAYIAGFIDGEGHISLTYMETVSAKFRVAIIVSQVDPRPLIFMQERLGGRIRFEKRSHKKSSWHDVWRWTISGFDLDSLLPQIIPYMIVKKDNAERAFQMRSLIRARGKGKGLPKQMPESEVKARLKLVEASKKV